MLLPGLPLLLRRGRRLDTIRAQWEWLAVDRTLRLLGDARLDAIYSGRRTTSAIETAGTKPIRLPSHVRLGRRECHEVRLEREMGTDLS